MMRTPRSRKHLVVANTQSFNGKYFGDLLMSSTGVFVGEGEGCLFWRRAGGGGARVASGLAGPVMDIDETIVNLYGFVAEAVEENCSGVSFEQWG